MPDILVDSRKYIYDKDPDHCPVCHHGIKASMIAANVVSRSEFDGDILQMIYRCPRDECQRAFIATYLQKYNSRTRYPEGSHVLRSTAPYSLKAPDTPKEIEELSLQGKVYGSTLINLSSAGIIIGFAEIIFQWLI